MAQQQLDPDGITAVLMGRAIEGDAPPLGGDLATVELDIDQFHEQYVFFASRELSMPCLTLDDEMPLPVDAIDVIGPTEEWGPAWLRGERYQIRQILGNVARRSETAHQGRALRYQEHSPADVVQFLGSRLREFVGAFVRGGGSLEHAETPRSIDVRVHTYSRGLRIHCSPSYLLHLSWYFGSPTTPAHGCVPPGRWRFLVTDSDMPLTLDPGVFDIPPTIDPHLTVK